MTRLDRNEILAKLARMAAAGVGDRLPLETVRLLKENIDHYDWVGIYLVEGDELLLGPFLGPPSPHARIKIGSGICGAAADSGETTVVDDVQADSRYLACSLHTRSEIVVPVFKNGQVVAELDIDSNKPAAFTTEDRDFLEAVARLLSQAF